MQIEKGHGRIEERKLRISDPIDWLRARHPNGQSVKSIIDIASTRHLRGKQSHERRDYISSLPPDACRAVHSIRAHWGIENRLHWTLDMRFGEDQCRIRKGRAVNNMAVIGHGVINAIQRVKPPRQSLKHMRKRDAWSVDVLDTVVKFFI